MSAEDEVRQRYPRAEASHRAATFEQGQLAATQGGQWDIFPSGGLGYQPIASGATVLC